MIRIANALGTHDAHADFASPRQGTVGPTYFALRNSRTALEFLLMQLWVCRSLVQNA